MAFLQVFHPNKGLLAPDSPVGSQGECQVTSCPWCVVTVPPRLSELPVAAQNGFFWEPLPAIELIVWRLADKMGNVDIVHLVLNIYGCFYGLLSKQVFCVL